MPARIVSTSRSVARTVRLTTGRGGKDSIRLGGALDGLEGFVDDPANPQGIVISVDVLRQGLLVRMPVENLVALP